MKRTITVTPYQPQWKDEFLLEKYVLNQKLISVNPLIHHIGSTSVPGLAAKPIIDILVEVSSLTGLDLLNEDMRSYGYTPRGEYGIPGRRYFVKGSTERTHHLHAFVKGSPHIKRHLAFRDYLISNPKIAEEYAEVKISASNNCNNDSQKYCDLKNSFVQEIEKQALGNS